MSYSLSSRPRDHERFPEAIDQLWRNADACAGKTLDRESPEYIDFDQAVSTGGKRVCWNSWIAPHNFEGFFLHFGDMLVKSGDWKTGKRVYAFARRSPDYEEWDYASVLEARIRDAKSRAAAFANDDPGDDPEIMVQSTYACTGCHAH